MDLWRIKPGKTAALMPGDEWLTGVRILDVYIVDAKCLSHPSTFDNTDTYEVVAFTGLALEFQEWRDYRISDPPYAMKARFADIIEHIERVLNHARTIERQAESAVQLSFAAMSHRTTEIMRLLTLITAIFMPLTLVTGLFGMNFDFIPWLHKSYGF